MKIDMKDIKRAIRAISAVLMTLPVNITLWFRGKFWSEGEAVVEKLVQGAQRLSLQPIVRPHLQQAYR